MRPAVAERPLAASTRTRAPPPIMPEEIVVAATPGIAASRVATGGASAAGTRMAMTRSAGKVKAIDFNCASRVKSIAAQTARPTALAISAKTIASRPL
jgi:hypothetical protein